MKITSREPHKINVKTIETMGKLNVRYRQVIHYIVTIARPGRCLMGE